MTYAAPRMAPIKPSPSAMASRRARELAAAGRDVISLSLGDPDFPTPDNVVAAAIRAMERGETKYTNPDGTPELKAAVREKFRRDNGLDFGVDQIIVSAGAKQVIFHALLATVAPGDEVIIPAPYWVSYPDMAMIADGIPVHVACPQNNGFRLRPEDLDAAITPRTRWLLLNSPNNPSGAGYTVADLKALADVLRRHPLPPWPGWRPISPTAS
jgi:aspartate aminotransferase